MNRLIAPVLQRIHERILQYNVITVGHVTHDRYGESWVAGGSAFYGAKVAASLGARARLLSAVGVDFALDHAIGGIETHLLRAGLTTAFINLYPADQPRVQRVEARASTLRPADLPWEWMRPTLPEELATDLLFLAPVLGELDPLDDWSLSVNAGHTALCIQGYLRACSIVDPSEPAASDLSEAEERRGARVTSIDSPLTAQLFDGVDTLFLSDEDLAKSSETVTLSDLRTCADLIYLTRGVQGCSIFERGRPDPLHIDAHPAQVIDPTGAGDTFAMATSLARCAGASPVEAGLFGAAVASIVIEGQGASALSRIDEVWTRAHGLYRAQKKGGIDALIL